MWYFESKQAPVPASVAPATPVAAPVMPVAPVTDLNAAIERAFADVTQT